MLQSTDPGNRYGVPYLWGTTGFTYNVDMIRARLPNAPVGSADMIFKPEIAKHFADCGITFIDEPTDVIPMALVYLGHDPNSLDRATSRRSRNCSRACVRTCAISAPQRC
jgi:putrescine transport system substrate-binding protein